jgi:hypothetical protein
VNVGPFLRSARFHLVATFVWAALAVPTVLWWRDSVFWVALMSLYANLVGHWAAYQAARAEER